MFIKIVKSISGNWYGGAAIVRNDNGDSYVICKSYETDNPMPARMSIMRDILIRGKEFGIKEIQCFDKKKIWLKILQRDQPIPWELGPIMHDIHILASEFRSFTLINSWHPLGKEAQKMASQVALNKMSLNWP
ncbi:hypothetical protein PTKIN_Ptkin14bG0225100 [Pterospermum kingtungense]